ncbi:MAG: TolC family protein [Candidatus Saganbacteria bacterium]|nr:TolC family protein [Candidatus Saganbacteria bacterium]
MKKIIVLICILFFGVESCWGLSLSDSLKTALDNNPDILGAQKAVEAEEAKAGSAFGKFMPLLTASGNYGTSYSKPYEVQIEVGGVNQQFIMGVDAQAPTKAWNLQLSQPIFAGGSILSGYGAAVKSLDGARADLANKILDVQFDVTSSYFDVLKSRENVALAQKSVEMADSHLANLKARFKAGISTRAEVLRTEVQAAEAEVGLTKARAAYELVKNKYGSALGIEVDWAQPFSEDKFDELKTFPTYNEILKIANNNRPDLKKLDLSQAMAEDQVSVAKGTFYPSVALVGTSNYSMTRYPIFDAQTQGWTVLATANWTLFDGLKNMNQVKEASANVEKLRFSKEGLKKAVALDVKNAYTSFATAYDTLKSTQKALELAGENYKLATLQYDAGLETNLEVLDAQVALTKSEIEFLQAKYDYELAKARINKATGTQIFKLNTGKQTFIGKITWIDIEGGFPGFITVDNAKFYLLGDKAKSLKAEAGKNERRVKIVGERKKDVVTIYMWGDPLEVVEYEWME